MNKSKDYSEYFNEDGSTKECPYDFHNENENFEAWWDRLHGIRMSLMPETEKKVYMEAMRNLRDKMQSSVGGEVFS